MSRKSGLTTRQFQRAEIDLAVEFVIDHDHRSQVQFSATSSARDAHIIRGRSIDISSGGMGILCRQFVPRKCLGTIRVFDPAAGADDGVHPINFEHAVRVHRVQMVSREPSYALGLAFVDPAADLDLRIHDLMKMTDVHPSVTNVAEQSEATDA